MRIRSAFAATVLLTALPAYRLTAQQPGVDIQAYHFRVDLPVTGDTIKGWASVLFETSRGYDDTLRLDLVGMTVHRVFDIHTLREVPAYYDGRVISIVTRGMARAERGVVVEYSGVPQDGLIIKATARGRRAFFADNWPNRARFWLPTIDHPSDKARVLWSVRAPRGLRIITNAPQCRPRGERRCLESAPIPTYTMVLGAARMTLSAHRPARYGPASGDTIPIEVLAYPEDSAFADSVPFLRATEIVESGSRIIGPFPYSRLAHVQSSTRYGGMENSTAIFYAENGYVRRTMREGVVRHETAHQWFGDAITEADWHHAWLSEGFATYFDLVIGADLDGDSLLRRGMQANLQTYLRSPVVNTPIIDTTVTDPNRMLSANSYQKGAWVLHMLRGLVGDTAFFRGIREYYRSYRDSSVVSDQFQRVMERAARRRLGWFFGQWLRQPGYPQLDVAWRVDSAASRVTVEVLQEQPGAWGTFAWPAVPIEFRRAGQVIARRSFALQSQTTSQSFRFELDQVPDQVAVDPDGQLLLVATVRGVGP